MSIVPLYVGCNLSYQVNVPTSFLFQVAVLRNDSQPIREESITVNRPEPLEQCQVGLMGNRVHRLLASPGELRLEYRATVDLQQSVSATEGLDMVPHAELPPEVLVFLNPSRYCETEKLSQFAWDEFGTIEGGYHKVQAVVDYVNQNLSYTPGSTDASTTAAEVLVKRQGVCRDYAHLAITFCRALGVPARYASGYAVALEPPDFHGFFEAYLGDAWYLFDATKLAPVSGFVRIGAGRDAADLSFATLIGSAQLQQMEVWAKPVQEHDIVPPPDRDEAVSSSD